MLQVVSKLGKVVHFWDKCGQPGRKRESHICLATLRISNFREKIVVTWDEHRPARQNVRRDQSRTPKMTPHVLPDCWLGPWPGPNIAMVMVDHLEGRA